MLICKGGGNVSRLSFDLNLEVVATADGGFFLVKQLRINRDCEGVDGIRIFNVFATGVYRAQIVNCVFIAVNFESCNSRDKLGFATVVRTSYNFPIGTVGNRIKFFGAEVFNRQESVEILLRRVFDFITTNGVVSTLYFLVGCRRAIDDPNVSFCRLCQKL